jgi:signal transduction histidine kinase
MDRNGKPGIGIGLTTVKKLIENLEGEIGFESTPKEGTTFHFSLPK